MLEKALTDAALKAKLGADLVKRCEDALTERTTSLWKAVGAPAGGDRDDTWRKGPSAQGQAWFLESHWPERSRKLYALAGEVAGKTVGP